MTLCLKLIFDLLQCMTVATFLQSSLFGTERFLTQRHSCTAAAVASLHSLRKSSY